MVDGKNANLVLFLTISLAATVFCAPALGRVIYVDDNAGGANNGLSWIDAYNYLQDALTEANITGEPVEIRVARGIYRPDRGAGINPGDRNATFQLINGVAIYGGYAGAGGSGGFGGSGGGGTGGSSGGGGSGGGGGVSPNPDVRDIKLYQSILSGDLNGDDVVVDELSRLLNESTRRDNSLHVVTGSHTDQTAVLDGFVITAGLSGVGGGELRGGAGMLIESGNPAVIDCLFTGNAAIGGAAALMNINGSEPTLIGCSFDWNDSLHGAVENTQSNPVFSECRFSRNSFSGMLNDNQSDPIVINCMFEDNRQQGMINRGSSNPNLTECTFKNNGIGGMENWTGSPILTDCTFDKNKREGMSNRSNSLPVLTGCTFTGHSNRAIDNGNSTLILRDCLFSDNTGFSGAAIDSYGDVILYGCTFIRNSARASGGAIRGSGQNSLTLNGCTFSGNSAGDGGAIRASGNIVLRNCLFDGNSARNGGAIMNWGELTQIYNCTFSGNRSDIEGSCVRQIRREGLSMSHCILWDNGQDPIGGEADVSYSDIQGGFPGPGNIDIDPLFARPGAWDPNGTPEDNSDDFWTGGDYHLLSQAGHWDSNSRSWVQDNATSPCIDAGDPNSPLGPEPFPNGARVNMGAYGATDKAGKSYFGGPTCEVILPGDINGDCVVDFEDLSIVVSHWMMRGEDFVNKPPTIRLIEPQDGAQITWPGPTMFRAEAHDPDGRIVSFRFVLQQIRDNGSSTLGLGAVNDEGNVWQREYTWQENARSGDWDVWAEATDNKNAVSVSEKITITLNR